jgi:hypothetical protein
MFTMGFHSANNFFSMGQLGQPKQLTAVQRDRLMAEIGVGLSKAEHNERIVTDISKRDPSLKSVLGDYTERYLDLSSYAASIYPKVNEINNRLSSDIEAEWAVTEDEEAYVRDWTVTVNTLQEILQWTYKPAGGVTPVTTIRTPAAAEPKVLGIPTSDLLVGGAVTVGLGVVLYAIFG